MASSHNPFGSFEEISDCVYGESRGEYTGKDDPELGLFLFVISNAIPSSYPEFRCTRVVVSDNPDNPEDSGSANPIFPRRSSSSKSFPTSPSTAASQREVVPPVAAAVDTPRDPSCVETLLRFRMSLAVRRLLNLIRRKKNENQELFFAVVQSNDLHDNEGSIDRF